MYLYLLSTQNRAIIVSALTTLTHIPIRAGRALETYSDVCRTRFWFNMPDIASCGSGRSSGTSGLQVCCRFPENLKHTHRSFDHYLANLERESSQSVGVRPPNFTVRSSGHHTNCAQGLPATGYCFPRHAPGRAPGEIKMQTQYLQLVKATITRTVNRCVVDCSDMVGTVGTWNPFSSMRLFLQPRA